MIRSNFPALERTERGLPVAYFDGPGGTQVPRAVVEAMTEYLYHHNANTHWAFSSSAETDALLAEARSVLADFLGSDAREIVFGQNMTSLTFHFARALAAAWQPGDRVVVTDLDHMANVAPWEALQRERGIDILRVGINADAGTLDWDALEAALERRPRLLAIGAASNALGTITDVGRACALARDAGALSFVDAVHYAPHALVDVTEIGCDFLVCSPYKFYGPHLGVLFGRYDLLERITPPKLPPAPDLPPDKFETGTLSHEAIVGAAAAVEFLAGLFPNGGRRERLRTTFAALHQRADQLFTLLWDRLNDIEGVRVYGPPPGTPRTPTAGFTVAGIDASAVAQSLNHDAVFVSHGDFYASRVIELLDVGPEGLVRAGCAVYTSEQDVNRLADSLQRLVREAAR